MNSFVLSTLCSMWSSCLCGVTEQVFGNKRRIVCEREEQKGPCVLHSHLLYTGLFIFRAYHIVCFTESGMEQIRGKRKCTRIYIGLPWYWNLVQLSFSTVVFCLEWKKDRTTPSRTWKRCLDKRLFEILNVKLLQDRPIWSFDSLLNSQYFYLSASIINIDAGMLNESYFKIINSDLRQK